MMASSHDPGSGLLRNQMSMEKILQQARVSGNLDLSYKSLADVPNSVWKINSEDNHHRESHKDGYFGQNGNHKDEEESVRWWECVELTHLTLAFNNISYISCDCRSLKSLTHLDLHCNKICLLPEEIGDMRQLTHLNISDNQLRNLPRSLGNLQSLQQLLMEKNELDTFPSEVCSIKRLATLNLSENRIRELPPEIGSMVNLRKLYVRGNSISYVPSDIDRLTNLLQLDISGNRLTIFPIIFSSPADLEVIHLDHNTLTHFPVLRNCSAIKEVFVQDNYITSISEEGMMGIASTTFLNLSRNKIKEIPNKIGCLTQLIRLDITNNDLTTLPHEIGFMKKLNIIFADGNPFKSLRREELMKGAEELKFILRDRMSPLTNRDRYSCNENRFPNFNDASDEQQGETHRSSINCSSSKQQLNKELLSSDPSSTGDKNMNSSSDSYQAFKFGERGESNSFEAVNLNHPNKQIRSTTTDTEEGELDEFKNKKSNVLITSLGKRFVLPSANENAFGGSCLPRIGGRYNPGELVTDGHTLKFQNKPPGVFLSEECWLDLYNLVPILCAHLSGNGWCEIPKGVYLFHECLQELDFSSNSLRILPDEIGRFTALRTLRLINNQLRTLPEALEKCSSLETLDVSYNSFTEIPRCVFQLWSLQSIMANNCKIRNIDANALRHMKYLRTLELQGNDIITVPPELGLCDQLKSLKLETNPFRIPRPSLLSKGTDEILDYLRKRISF